MGPRWTHYFLSWFYREDQGNPNFSPKCAATIASICVNLQNFISWSSASPVAQPEGQIWSCLTWKGDPKWRWKSTPLLSCRHGPLAPFGAAVNMRGWAAMGWKVWCGKFDDSFLWSQEVSAFYLPGVGPTEYLDVWGLQISTDASTWQLVCKVSPVPLGHALQIQNDMIQTGSMHTSTGISTHFGAFAKRLQHLRSKETFHRFINHLQMASGWICFLNNLEQRLTSVGSSERGIPKNGKWCGELQKVIPLLYLRVVSDVGTSPQLKPT